MYMIIWHSWRSYPPCTNFCHLPIISPKPLLWIYQETPQNADVYHIGIVAFLSINLFSIKDKILIYYYKLKKCSLYCVFLVQSIADLWSHIWDRGSERVGVFSSIENTNHITFLMYLTYLMNQYTHQTVSEYRLSYIKILYGISKMVSNMAAKMAANTMIKV